MSPSEDQLRAALRDGEGPTPDADRVIGHAIKVRRERRNRMIGAVATVVAVGGISVGIASTNGGNDRKSTANPKHSGRAELHAGATTAADGVGAGKAVPPVAGPNSGYASMAACPAKPIQYALPGGGGTGQFGANDPLVAKPVSSLTFCIYDTTSAQTYKGSRVLEGAAAQHWIDQANRSSVKHNATDYCSSTQRNVEILVGDSSGAALAPLSVTGGCQEALVTNGTAVRYVEISELDSVTSGTQPSPTSGMSGSPPR